MTLAPPNERYTGVAIALHWVIATLILFNLWLGLAHESLSPEWKVMPVRKATGMTMLALSLARRCGVRSTGSSYSIFHTCRSRRNRWRTRHMLGTWRLQ